LAAIFLTQLAIKQLLMFPPHPTSVFALTGESRPTIIHVEMNANMSINSTCPNLWVPTAGPLQGLTVMQQCVYQMTFRNDYEFKKRLV